MDGRKEGWMDGWMDGWKDGRKMNDVCVGEGLAGSLKGFKLSKGGRDGGREGCR